MISTLGSAMNEPATCNLTLADGRNLSYTDIGTGENDTWIHCHGIPGSRNELMHLTEELAETGVRLIVPDRPGYGNSTPCPDFCFASHSDDLRQLADHLKLARFSLSGFSGGGVFAMAAAHDLGKRVSRLTIAATPAVPLMENPFEYASELTGNAWRAALDNPEELALELQILTTSSESLCTAMMDAAGEDERRFLSSEPVYKHFHASIRTALQQGSTSSAKALARDTGLTANCMSIQLNDINIPMQVIHGTQDQLVHKEHQAALLHHLPNARPRLIAGAGHFDVLSAIWD